jgi:hypothetical protein
MFTLLLRSLYCGYEQVKVCYKSIRNKSYKQSCLRSLTKHHAMKNGEATLHAFITFAIDGGERLASRSGHCNSQKKNSGSIRTGGCVRPRACLNVVAERRDLACTECNPGHPARSLVNLVTELSRPCHGSVSGIPWRRTGFAPGSFCLGLVVDRVAVGHVSVRVLRHSPVNIIPHSLMYQLQMCCAPPGGTCDVPLGCGKKINHVGLAQI